jgi:hypothetical protein
MWDEREAEEKAESISRSHETRSAVSQVGD